jgi:pimeloyl-ACP methyl ester carboxylesterase
VSRSNVETARERRTEMTTTRGSIETRTLKVPGATLYVEVRGTGPVLLCISGGPTDAGMFTDLAGRLADRYTVVCYDQRGHSRSTLDSEPEDIPVALHADDAAAILEAVGKEPAYVYGNSGGATIGLDLVARHTDLVRTLIAHEPPLMELLPDAERWRAVHDDIDRTYREAGVFPAMAKFGAAGRRGRTEVQRGDATDPAHAGERGDDGQDGRQLRPVHRPRDPADRRIRARHRRPSERTDEDRLGRRRDLG